MVGRFQTPSGKILLAEFHHLNDHLIRVTEPVPILTTLLQRREHDRAGFLPATRAAELNHIAEQFTLLAILSGAGPGAGAALIGLRFPIAVVGGHRRYLYVFALPFSTA